MARCPSKVIPSPLPVSSNTGFPLLLSAAQESFNIPPDFPAGLLSLGSGQLMGWRNQHAQPRPDLALQCYLSGRAGRTEMTDIILE